MKFTNGQWLLQDGVTAHYAAQAYDVHEDGPSLVVTAPTRVIRHRGDTLQGPILNLRISAVREDVIRVRVEHFTGESKRGPEIPLWPDRGFRAETTVGADEAVLRAGRLSAHLKRGEAWDLSFMAGNRVITRGAAKSLGYVQWPGQGNFLHQQLSLGVGESVYGLGERFTAFVKNGQVVENTNRDGGAASDQAYKAIPFYLTNRGYGVLVNETGPVSFEIATENVSRMQFSLEAESLEYLIIYGPTPKEILRKLTALTGRPALPPAWSFGLWLSTSFTTNYDEKTTTGFIDEMRQRDLPLSVFHFDCFWMREFNWCDFQWDARMFPDPRGMLRRLHDRGLKICVWINPYIAQRSPLFEEGRANGYFIRRSDGSVWQSDLWQPGMAIVDFTNPAAAEWYAGKLRALLEMGVDTFKTDFGERIPTAEVIYHDGSDPRKMHNFYPILYNETVFSLIQEVRGKGEAAVFARSTYASGQRFPVHWGGDCWSTFESMSESLRGGLSLGLCGFGYWSHDIGGFEGQPPADVYKRWLAFGLLSSHSRLHGSSSYRVPWKFDEEACAALRFFTKLKLRLMPYLYAAAVEAHREGVPMMRAMMLEFPEDPACELLDRQYMLGSALLVAPVMQADGEVQTYLPPGRWTQLLTGEVVEGGRWIREQHGFLSLPIFVRPNSVIAFGARDDRPDYDYSQQTRFAIYQLGEGAPVSVQIPNQRGEPGARFTARRVGSRITARWEGPAEAAWSLQLVGVPKILKTDAGSAELLSEGVLIRPRVGVGGIEIDLP